MNLFQKTGILIMLCLVCKMNCSNKKEPPILLKVSDLDECQTEIKNFCENKKSNNFELLTCLHNNVPTDVQLSESCQHVLWQAKNNLTRAVSFFVNGISAQSCENDIIKLTDCKHEKETDGPVIPCLLEFKDKINDPTCRRYLDFLKPLIFSDYRLTYKLVEYCNKDIEKLHCGRMTNYMKVGDQGSTIDCLALSYERLSKLCKHEVLKISELQSDDWNNDRPLYLACREDRERLCPHINSGSGLVYECLFQNKMNPYMSQKCAEKLRLRQKLHQKDFSIDYKFKMACSTDIKRHNCDVFEGVNNDYIHANLSKIILCLEEVKLEGMPIKPECVSKVKRLRFSLLEDHKINPEVVTNCEEEIKTCEEEGGKQSFVIHCLMEMARKNMHKHVNGTPLSACFDAVENLLMEVNIGEDFDVDAALLEDCNEEINKRCYDVQRGQGRVIDCLMALTNKKHTLNEKCLDRLMEIQYFFSRSFKVSRRLVVHCKNDAKRICSKNLNSLAPGEDSHLISCLYRNRDKTTLKCILELNRLMMNRARNIDLPPAIQESCMSDLVTLCSDKLGRDEEMFCLEDSYDSLSKKCQKKVSDEIDQEESMPTLSRIFLDSCEQFSQENCKDYIHEEGSAGIMKCLISNKNHPNMPEKCKAGFQHHQLMLMKEVKLSQAFRQACNSELDRFCSHSTKKLEMVRCLSEHVYNDSMLNADQRIGNKCRKELNFELLQIGENIDMDHELQASCLDDKKTFCRDVEKGNGKIIECLRKNHEKLQMKCRELLFERELIEAVDSSVDYTLITKCKAMIKRHCKGDPSKIFECLREHRNDDEFDDECHDVVVSRMRLRSEDIRLNPVLYKSCMKDIEKLCLSQMETTSKTKVEVEGLVIHCLRMAYVHKIQSAMMSTSCVHHISELIKDSAIDYLQDPALVKACRPVMEKKCLREIERHKLVESNSEVEGCLREALLTDQEVRDQNPQCFIEIVRRLDENKVDIQIDPVLNRLCHVDAETICQGLRRGEGRVMSCLLDAAMIPSIVMNNECRKALKERSELWSLSVKIAPPDSLGELYEHVQSSSSKLYFQCILFTLLSIVFFIGLYCGRITKKLQQMKNK